MTDITITHSIDEIIMAAYLRDGGIKIDSFSVKKDKSSQTLTLAFRSRAAAEAFYVYSGSYCDAAEREARRAACPLVVEGTEFLLTNISPDSWNNVCFPKERYGESFQVAQLLESYIKIPVDKYTQRVDDDDNDNDRRFTAQIDNIRRAWPQPVDQSRIELTHRIDQIIMAAYKVGNVKINFFKAKKDESSQTLTLVFDSRAEAEAFYIYSGPYCNAAEREERRATCPLVVEGSKFLLTNISAASWDNVCCPKEGLQVAQFPPRYLKMNVESYIRKADDRQFAAQIDDIQRAWGMQPVIQSHGRPGVGGVSARALQQLRAEQPAATPLQVPVEACFPQAIAYAPPPPANSDADKTTFNLFFNNATQARNFLQEVQSATRQTLYKSESLKSVEDQRWSHVLQVNRKEWPRLLYYFLIQNPISSTQIVGAGHTYILTFREPRARDRFALIATHILTEYRQEWDDHTKQSIQPDFVLHDTTGLSAPKHALRALLTWLALDSGCQPNSRKTTLNIDKVLLDSIYNVSTEEQALAKLVSTLASLPIFTEGYKATPIETTLVEEAVHAVVSENYSEYRPLINREGYLKVNIEIIRSRLHALLGSNKRMTQGVVAVTAVSSEQEEDPAVKHDIGMVNTAQKNRKDGYRFSDVKYGPTASAPQGQILPTHICLADKKNTPGWLVLYLHYSKVTLEELNSLASQFPEEIIISNTYQKTVEVNFQAGDISKINRFLQSIDCSFANLSHPDGGSALFNNKGQWFDIWYDRIHYENPLPSNRTPLFSEKRNTVQNLLAGVHKVTFKQTSRNIFQIDLEFSDVNDPRYPAFVKSTRHPHSRYLPIHIDSLCFFDDSIQTLFFLLYQKSQHQTNVPEIYRIAEGSTVLTPEPVARSVEAFPSSENISPLLLSLHARKFLQEIKVEKISCRITRENDEQLGVQRQKIHLYLDASSYRNQEELDAKLRSMGIGGEGSPVILRRSTTYHHALVLEVFESDITALVSKHRGVASLCCALFNLPRDGNTWFSVNGEGKLVDPLQALERVTGYNPTFWEQQPQQPAATAPLPVNAPVPGGPQPALPPP